MLNDEKFILDATAGNRLMWTNKAHPNVLYIDERSEVAPDEIRDFRKLPYSDNSFYLVIFDPPHMVRNSIHGRIQKDYGVLKCETWQSDLQQGLRECMRVLKIKGVLLFKWNTCSKRIKEVKAILPFEPLVSQTTKGNFKRGHNESETVWFTFMKIPEVHDSPVVNKESENDASQ